MSANQDLMERLAAADPLPDAERLNPAEQHEADALLARLLATPAEPAVRAPTRALPRRRVLVAAATACAALIAFAAIDLIDSDTPGPTSIVERAVAAVSDDDAVYHVSERLRASGEIPGGRQTVYRESWHTTDGHIHLKLFETRDGRRGSLVSEYAGRRTPGRRGGPALRWDASTNTILSVRFGTPRGWRGAPGLSLFADPAAELQALEAQGRLRLAGRANVGGRRAYRLTSGYVEGHVPGTRERIVFLVDRETYLPISNRFTLISPDDGNLDVLTRYLVYERLPLDDQSRARLALDPHPGAKCAPGADETMGEGSLDFPNPCAR